jgi:hypothetical protein
MSNVLRLFLAVTIAGGVAPLLSAQDASTACKDVKYEHQNQIDSPVLRVAIVRGTASDPQGVAIPNLCVGIFTETEHKLVAANATNDNGAFEVKHVPPGNYRLVAQYAGLCPANIRIRVQPRSRRKKRLIVYMKPASIDSCSYGALARAHGPDKATYKYDARFACTMR